MTKVGKATCIRPLMLRIFYASAHNFAAPSGSTPWRLVTCHGPGPNGSPLTDVSLYPA